MTSSTDRDLTRYADHVGSLFQDEYALRLQTSSQFQHLPLARTIHAISRGRIAQTTRPDLINLFLNNQADAFLLPRPPHNEHQMYFGLPDDPNMILNMRRQAKTDVIRLYKDDEQEDVRIGTILTVGPDLVECAQIRFKKITDQRRAFVRQPDLEYHLITHPSSLPNEELIAKAFGEENYASIMETLSQSYNIPIFA